MRLAITPLAQLARDAGGVAFPKGFRSFASDSNRSLKDASERDLPGIGGR